MLKQLLALSFILFASFAYADANSNADSDKSELNQLLSDFLANSVNDDLKNHSRFWADDLIYTSSAGKRFDKAVIIDGIKSEMDSDKEPETPPKYWAEETDIRLYGNTAIVVFKLGGEWKEESEVKKQYYYNTGTFLKRDGQWQVIAWQATKIPQK